ncbi:bifunctional methylenetetrahydrofolate dehydrogenase/methenyltetrahydrofolate cyclohydrolase FolD [Buchnera aphidicola (Mollitrichosiphum nigrofasciatum)]|uniref:bifunctional methylenetetrahydrofolate dehydrogenase/methenyltetrahydrofolate cyclohydrolase FolD n=1 Tax=Buchnera aphidicola TaxID=9 RepID=UPI0031B829AE
MQTIILNGKKIASKIKKTIKKKIKIRKKKKQRIPGLAVIMIGENISSKIYVNKKRKSCKKLGFISKLWKFKKTTHEHKILKLIHKLNYDRSIDGILVQLPLPKNLNIIKIMHSISPNKDVDGFHPYNIGSLCQKKPKLRSCTPKGIITLLKNYNIKMKGMHAVIIGASNIVGRPMSLELLLEGCTTTVTHRFTKNIKQHIQSADLIIVAIGVPNFIDDKFIKPGAIIIDVGINKLKNGKIVGDVKFESVYKKASYITPVPGGVGPMTVATLLQNTLETCEKYNDY